MYERTHPVMIFSNLWRVFYLIIIPVLRGFVLALQKDLLAWVSGAWVDILVLLFMTAIAVMQWRFKQYICDDNAIKVRSGLFFKRETTIFWNKITTATAVESFYLRPFGAVYFRADTMGGSLRSADMTMFLSRPATKAIMNRYGGESAESSIKKQYVPSAISILALAILTSNSFAGIIFISTFVSQSGKLLGNEFSNTLIYTFEDLARRLAFGIPPAAAAIAYVLFGGWLIGFLLTLINYRSFSVVRKYSTLSISGGAVTTREYNVSYDKICFVEIRQSAVTMLLKLYTLYIYAVGYGKHKDDISCVIPAEKENTFTANRQMLFPDFIFSEPDIKSPSSGVMRFIFQPLIPIVSLPVIMVIFLRFFPSWNNFILFTGFMLMIPCVLFMIVRIIAYKTGGIAKKDRYYTIRYSSLFSIHTVIVPEDKIALVNFKQSIFQKRGKHRTCDLVVQTTAEGKKMHMCRNVDMHSVQELF